MGIEKPSGDTVRVLVETVAHIGSWQWTTVAVGPAGLAALFAMSRFVPKVPGAVVVVIVSNLAADAFDLASHGVKLVGEVPTGCSFVSWSSVIAEKLVDMLGWSNGRKRDVGVRVRPDANGRRWCKAGAMAWRELYSAAMGGGRATAGRGSRPGGLRSSRHRGQPRRRWFV